MSRRGAREGRGAQAAAARRMRGLNMAQPRPSLTLIVDVDERIDSEELRLEIGRSYTYVGSALVRTHAAAVDDAPVENTLRMLVKLGTRQYLNEGEEGSSARSKTARSLCSRGLRWTCKTASCPCACA